MEINISSYIDYTNLKANCTDEDIRILCNTAIEHVYASVCVNPNYVALAKEILANTQIKVCTVVGFPLGANTLKTKICEAKQAIKAGADEIDLVVNISKLVQNDFHYIEHEINKIKSIAKNKVLKVIVETCYLTTEQKEKVAKLLLKTKAEFIKTSTGFGPEGAKIEDIKMWREILGAKKYIKAAGGIKTYQEAIEFINAGANRIGTSSKLS